MRKFFAALAFTVILSGTSWASLVYTTDNGLLGAINIQNVSSIDTPAVYYRGLDGDTFIASYWTGTESRVIVAERTTNTAASGDNALVFRSEYLTSSLNGSGDVLEGVYNTQSAVSSRNGRGLFVASRENASLIELDTEGLKPVRSYIYEAEDEDSTPHMQGALINYGSIYGLVEAGEAESVFLRFDGQLKERVHGAIKISFDQEASSMSWLSGSRIAIATSSGVGLAGSDGFYMLAETDSPAKSVCPDNGSGFWFTTQDDAGNNTLYHYPSDAETFSEIRSESGQGCQLLSLSNEMFAAILGEKIFICTANNGSVLKEFNSNALGGVPVSMALRYASGDNANSSSGSCNAGTAGMIMLAACIAMMAGRRH